MHLVLSSKFHLSSEPLCWQEIGIQSLITVFLIKHYWSALQLLRIYNRICFS